MLAFVSNTSLLALAGHAHTHTQRERETAVRGRSNAQARLLYVYPTPTVGPVGPVKKLCARGEAKMEDIGDVDTRWPSGT